MAREKETVICRICLASHSISETKLCDCGSRLYTSLEISKQVSELRSKMASIAVEIAEKESELFFRRRRRTVEENGQKVVKDVFFDNVHGVPQGMKPASKAAKPKMEVTAAQVAEYE